MEIEFDEVKRVENIRKHGIDFKACIPVFLDGNSFDTRSDRSGEQRCILIGALNSRVFAVVYTIRGERLRIISARKARKPEVEKWKANANTS
ncbi:MAG: BrnT family toxin [Methylobacterium sp.]|nr:BrnT family toxin [Methylobacterium sp.]MCA3602089.1 BrnT family toxin [Methylobacterium sp.]MCA3614866.1 BrnT family toxin [Methylobacterium sp.]MCA4911091.1 BrnT family toxin [Methylobacterium sp.]